MIEKILTCLDKVRSSGRGRFTARCPSHDDRSPSLSLCELHDGRILIHCFAGCSPVDILNSIGLEMVDLFPDGALGEFRGWEKLKHDIEFKKKSKKLDHIENEKNVLIIAKNMRANGERLSSEDLEREKRAFIEVRNYGNNNG